MSWLSPAAYARFFLAGPETRHEISIEAKLASIKHDLRREAQQFILSTESLIANEQACSQSLVLALTQARASSEEQQARMMAQMEVQTARAGRAEALVCTKAGLLAAERASSISLALENIVFEERLKCQEENTRKITAQTLQLGNEINLLSTKLASQHARHEAEAAALRHTSSAQSQLLQAAKDEADLTISSLRKQLQPEADQNRATNQVKQALEKQVLGLQRQRQLQHVRVDGVEKELAQAKDFFDKELDSLRSQILAAQDNIRHIGGNCNALKEEARQAVDAHAAAVQTREEVERELQDLRQATSAQQDHIASLESQLQQSSVPGGLEWGLATHAGEPSSPSQGLPDWGPDSPDEADGAPDPDEQDITEASDATTQDELCVMRNFAPMEMPERPDNLEVAEEGEMQVAQLASHHWHHRCLAVLEYHGISWKGCWDLTPFPGSPDIFLPSREALSLVGEGAFGRVLFGQRWVGWGDLRAPQIGWTEGWESVAVKMVMTSASALQEVDALQKLQGAMYEEGCDLDDSLGWMREEWEGAEGSAREEGHARWLLALKTAVRQAFQGLDQIHSCGLVHADVKPNNFRVSRQTDGSQLRLIITDMGNSCTAGSDPHLTSFTYYTSPEGLDYFNSPGQHAIGSAADVFSMGCVLFELLTGLYAFARDEDMNLSNLQFRRKISQHQGLWGRESAQGSTVPHGLEALRENLPDPEDCRQAEDLLQCMLQIEPSSRPSIEEALAHPFLQGL